MNEIADRYRRRADAFAALINRTPPERWASPSPCTGWLARDIVAHIVRHSAETLRDKAGVRLAPARTKLDDPAGAFQWIRAAVEEVLDDPDTAIDVAEHLDAALSFDLPQHWWDLAKATGQDATMQAEEVEAIWETLSAMPSGWWKWQVDHGHYAPAVHVPDDASLQHRLVALIGRDPCWSP
ncbi:MAG TPA: maleylpyruvate isomerase N-terminal domain-containing protein [Acidimicrobiia bacterium]